jgi:Protein of unknown function (DUF732)
VTIPDPQPIGADDGDTGTALAPSETPTEHAFAWALDTDDPGDGGVAFETRPLDESWSSRTTLWLCLCTIVAAAVVAVLAGVLVSMRAGHRSSPTPTPAMTSTSVPVPPPAAAPPTVTKTVVVPSETVDAAPSRTTVETLAPPAPPPPPRAPAQRSPSQADLDERFMGDLTASGMLITSVSAVIASAHEICAYLAAGHTPVDAAGVVLRTNTTLTPATAVAMVDSAVAVYCPHYSG